MVAGQSNVVMSLRDTIVRGTAPWKALAAAEVKRPVASIHIYRVGDPLIYLPVGDADQVGLATNYQIWLVDGRCAPNDAGRSSPTCLEVD